MLEDYTAISNAPNSPDLNGKYLGLISTDFIKVSDTLKEAAYQVKKRGFSDFPIFVTSQRPIEIGQKLIGVNELNENKWNYHASMMEEFVQRNLITSFVLKTGKTGGIEEMLWQGKSFMKGVYCYKGHVTHALIGKLFKKPVKDIQLLLMN